MRALSLPSALLVVLVAHSPASMAFDEAAARAFAKQNDCFKCHAPDKTKKGPSYVKIAAKYKAKPDAEAKMLEHALTAQKVKLEDGTEEDHKALEKKDTDKIRNLIQWIRSH